MSISSLFTHRKFIPRKRMRDNYLRDPVFNDIIKGDPELKQILDRPDELRELHQKMREKARDGKLDKHDMQRIVYDLAHGKGEDISSLEGKKIAREFFPDSTRRYSSSDSESVKDTGKEPNVREMKSNSKTNSEKKPAHMPPAYLTYRAKSISASSDSGKTEKKSSFFDSMRSVSRNKR